LLHSPKVLFLDEPTLGLDPDSRHRLWTIVRNLNATNGVAVRRRITWTNAGESRIASRSSIVSRIVAQGSPRELREQTGSFESLEAAFLVLTGSAPRDDAPASVRPAAKLVGSRR
jgi:ABC-2 type transport system ATP-binding protein